MERGLIFNKQVRRKRSKEGDDGLDYATIGQGLYSLWTGYIVDLLGLSAVPAPTSSSFSPSQIQNWHGKLVKADYHGCSIRVTRAKNHDLIGVGGIVLQETQNSFTVVTSTSSIKGSLSPAFVYTIELIADLIPST